MKFAKSQETTASKGREVVVLVHGLASNRATLRPIERQLRRGGYETLNWGYRSVRRDIGTLSEALYQQLRQLSEDSTVGRIHLVTHSMGSIIARAALAGTEFERLGRIVMLAPPHRGSHVATSLSSLLGWFCRPLAQLSDDPDSFVNNLPEPVGHEIGIIAAARDRVVRIESTCLSQQADHIVVDSGHTSMLFREDTWYLVESFLRRGTFRTSMLASRCETQIGATPRPRNCRICSQ